MSGDDQKFTRGQDRSPHSKAMTVRQPGTSSALN
ncbi:hypothetical protein SMJ63A_60131 [Stenotrophomonas geniculata]